MSNGSPAVSIGLPVYNGERYLRAAVESVLAQTLSDFELIVSDNASNDGTESIAREYARTDSRVRYVRNPTNIGPIPNFNQTFRLAHGRYFKWLGADDVIRPQFLERCIEVLDADASVVICTSRYDEIDANGDRLRAQPYHLDLSDPLPHRRLARLMGSDRGHALLFGVIRSSAMRRTSLMAPYHGSDRAFLAEILLHGRMRVLSEVLWLSREHPERSLYVRTTMPGWQPTGARGPAVPHLAIAAEMLHVIRRAPLTQAQRMQCFVALGWSLSKRASQLVPVFFAELGSVIEHHLPTR